MAEEAENGQEKTEDPTDKRRQEFREKGEIASSKEFTSTAVIACAIFYVYLAASHFFTNAKLILINQFYKIRAFRINENDFVTYLGNLWLQLIYLILPLFISTAIIAIAVTFVQTKFNFSAKRLKPNFQRLNPFSGIKRMVSSQALMELGKGLGKTAIISIVTFAILSGEWDLLPRLLHMDLTDSWSYWNKINSYLFWSTSVLMIVIAIADYFYNYFSLEKKMKMSKQEVKDEFKKTEGDPLIKMRIRRIQRDIAMNQMISATKDATVVITNPTHYSIALKYESGMLAPMMLGKGIDHIALRMREVAKEHDVPIVENPPLARTLYKVMEIGEYIPIDLYKAISEVIRFVMKKKYGGKSRKI